jgi:hypothetical protein
VVAVVVMLVGQAPSVGACVSLTVTVKLQFGDILPAASVALQVTVVVPTGKLDPEDGVQVIVGEAVQLSVAVGVKLTFAAHCPTAVVVVMLVGQAMVGACVSLTVTVKLQLAPPPAALHVTVVTPRLNIAPEGGVQVTGPHPAVVVGAV